MNASKTVCMTCLILVGIIDLYLICFHTKEKPAPAYKVECIEGYSFIIDSKGNIIQIFEQTQHGLPCIMGINNMKKWKHTITFKDFWQREDLSVKEKGLLAAERLKNLELLGTMTV